MTGVSEFTDTAELCWLQTSRVKIEEVLFLESTGILMCTGMFRKAIKTIRSKKLIVFMDDYNLIIKRN